MKSVVIPMAVFTRSSDILRPSDDKARQWDPVKDTHVGRIMWEVLNTDKNGGCKTQMR